MSFLEDGAITAAALQAFADQGQHAARPVLNQLPLSELAQKLGLSQLIPYGGLQGERLNHFLADYLAASTCLHHPHFMAHQVAVPLPQSALAALVDGFTNNAMAIYEMGPAAAAVEHTILEWMLTKIGWSAAPLPGAHHEKGCAAAGVLTHGGSLANLTALSAARASIAPSAWETGTPPGLVILAPPSCHYSIARAAGIMGLGQRAVIAAPTDALGRLDPNRLSDAFRQIATDGRRVLAVVANACSTALGLYDPLRDIAEICRAHDARLHVDGAHGASVLLSPRLRHLVDGIELAQSVVWDAHKMLRTSTLCAALLVKDHRHLDRAFREEASYLFHDKDEPGFDFIHRTVECTKAGLGLKLFFALAYEGEAAIARMIERQTDLAQQAAQYLEDEPDIEVAVEPQSNIVCFRLAGSDALQLEMRRRLTQHGEFYISTAEALGRRWLRLALMNPATTLDDIKALLAELRAARARIIGETGAT